MNWEAIGAIGEIIGALAVVITLVFLILQLRTNSAAGRAQTRQALTDNVQTRFLATATNPEFAQLLARIRAGCSWDDLDDGEAEQIRNWAASVFNQVANYYHQYQLGTIHKADWETRRDLLVIQLEQPAIREFWDSAAQFHGQAFFDEIDKHL